MQDPYSTLGLSSGASSEDIKKSFRQLALQHHPDRHQGSPESVRQAAARKFQAITEAYDILTDDTKRAAYHRARSHPSASTSQAYSAHSTGYGYGYSRSTHYQYTDASASSAYSGRARPTMWHQLSRSFAQRPFEMILLATLAGVAGFGVWGVEAYWHRRNAGRRFEDIHKRSLSGVAGGADSAGGPSVDAEGGGGVPAWVKEREGQVMPSAGGGLAPRGFGCSARSRPYHSPGPGTSKQVADMPLSLLIEMEEEERQQKQNEKQQHPRAAQQSRHGHVQTTGPAESSAAGRGGTAGTVVDKAHIFRISPPGQMAGHKV